MTLKTNELDIGEALVGLATPDRMESPLKPKRLTLLVIVSFLIITGLLLFTFYLQILKGGHYQALARNNQVETSPLKAPRGTIYGKYFKTLAENVNYEDKTVRFYNYPMASAHLVGYIDTEGNGKTGLESYYNDYLKGKDGFTQTEYSSSGGEERLISRKEAEIGKSLLLHIDSDLQNKVYELLPDDKKSAVVILDPKTGGILSLVSKPSFNNNLFSESISPEEYARIIENPQKPLFNRAVNGQYPPGSIWKIFLAAAALEEKVFDPYRKQDTPVRLTIPNKYDPDVVYIFPDWKDHGSIDMFDALRQSSNVYFYNIGELLGWKDFRKYALEFGFGEVSGLDLSNEAEGFIPGKGWLGDLYHSSIGQGNVKVTPLQIAMATGAISSGKVYEPQLVDKITDEDNSTIKDFLPNVLNSNFIGEENLELVRKGMNSSAWQVPGLDTRILGKTGTAQFAPNSETYHTWFTSLTDDLVVTVLVEEGKSGSGTALPIAKSIYKWYYSRK